MGRVRWADPNWPNILEGQAVKLAARIKFGPIGPTRIGPQPIRVRAGPARLARIFFKFFLIINFKKMIYIYIYMTYWDFFLNPIVTILMKMKIKGIVDFI